ncbi:thioesterase family protein [Kiloniella laminariae]|uniref:Thioesterase family protein n=1 Tax=Kiloniella laminariae TaxID=454162 RepID=A0ABT4LNQ0_9PROT|nr:thioesterase family protein [Kiloniella laminariae]MCZ4282681.1 thioesterase family protein [Kiloniella laminariae]
MTFELPVTIRFQHCDPAGIVFYPRYFEMFNLTIEEWFEQVIGSSFHQLHLHQKIAVPTVRMETEFRAMSRLEDIVVFNLRITAIGKSSMDCTIEAVCNNELRCTSNITLVCVDMTISKARSWPQHILSSMKKYLEETK